MGWSDFAQTLGDGIQDAGLWVGQHIGEITSVAAGINSIINPTEVQSGHAPSSSQGNLYTPFFPPYMATGSAGAGPAPAESGSLLGFAMLGVAALVVVVLIAKR